MALAAIVRLQHGTATGGDAIGDLGRWSILLPALGWADCCVLDGDWGDIGFVCSHPSAKVSSVGVSLRSGDSQCPASSDGLPNRSPMEAVSLPAHIVIADATRECHSDPAGILQQFSGKNPRVSVNFDERSPNASCFRSFDDTSFDGSE